MKELACIKFHQEKVFVRDQFSWSQRGRWPQDENWCQEAGEARTASSGREWHSLWSPSLGQLSSPARAGLQICPSLAPHKTTAQGYNHLLQLSECREVFLDEAFAAGPFPLRSVNNLPLLCPGCVVPVVWKGSIWAVPSPLGTCWQYRTYIFPVWLEEWVALAF